jgi:glycosyltransferase involved in cell wall biosynthesis
MTRANQAGISVVVPALNEEKNLRSAVANVMRAAHVAGNVPVEILVVDDGSTDGTAKVAAELEAEYPVVRTIHHDRNKGFGTCFLSGLHVARYEWITVFPGDNVVSVPTLANMLRNGGKADVTCAYTLNTECRTRLRNCLSAVFSFVYTTTFNLHIRYINATPVYPVAPLRGMKLRCLRYSFPSEPTVRLLRAAARSLNCRDS